MPLPKKDSIVDATDRRGKIITKGRIINVCNEKRFDHTMVVSIAIPKKFVQQVRGITIPKRGKIV